MKFERVKGNVPVFSGDYEGRDRTIFGGTEQSNDINQQFTPEFIKGWGIVGKNEFPTLQDFNALGFTHSALIGYLYQSGVAQWVAGADYYTGSIAVQGVDLYVAIQDKPTLHPSSLQGWRLVSPALLNTTGNSTSAPMTQKSVTDALNKKWDIQATTGSGDIARMSEVQKKRDLDNSRFESVKGLTLTGYNDSSRVLFRAYHPDDGYLPTLHFGGESGWAGAQKFRPNLSGTIALTSDIPQSLGIDQTWKDMTSQRVAYATYTNNTGKPIEVGIHCVTARNGAAPYISCNGVRVSTGTSYRESTIQCGVNAIIPPNSTYSLMGDVERTETWAELRS